MMTYQTSRLSVIEIFSAQHDTDTFVSITTLLTPTVVETLPPSFRNIHSISDAQDWLTNIVSESRLFMVKHTDTQTTIGFVFVFTGNDEDAHIGYLLGESYWGKGYATELLSGLIDFIKQEHPLTRLIAGVATDNIVSSKLLYKLGFVKRESENNETVFYEMKL